MAWDFFRLVALLVCILFLAVACTSHPASPSPVPPFSADNYPVLRNMGGERPNAEQRYIGLVKVYADHHVRDRKGTEGSYLVQGAGTLVTVVVSGQQQLYVVTARHIVIPSPFIKTIVLNPDDPKQKKEIKFNEISEVWSRVLVGIGVEPSAMLLAKTGQGILSDVAFLEIPLEEYSFLRPYLDLFTRLGPPSAEQMEDLVGSDVRVWGYPAGLSPQSARDCCTVTAIRSEYMILNQALMGGYSGGLVLHSDGKTILGLPVRSDEKVQQTIALRWDIVEFLLNDLDSLERIALGDSLEIIDENIENEQQQTVRFTYQEFYSRFMPTPTPESKWWEVWKRW